MEAIMSDEKKERPKMGGIDFRTLGGGSKRSDTQQANTPGPESSNPKILTPQTFDTLEHQTSGPQVPETNPGDSNVQTFERSTPQAIKPQGTRRSKVQKSKRLNVERVQQTAWIPPDLARWLRLQAVNEDREISEIMTEALEMYRKLR